MESAVLAAHYSNCAPWTCGTGSPGSLLGMPAVPKVFPGLFRPLLLVSVKDKCTQELWSSQAIQISLRWSWEWPAKGGSGNKGTQDPRLLWSREQQWEEVLLQTAPEGPCVLGTRIWVCWVNSSLRAEIEWRPGWQLLCGFLPSSEWTPVSFVWPFGTETPLTSPLFTLALHLSVVISCLYFLNGPCFLCQYLCTCCSCTQHAFPSFLTSSQPLKCCSNVTSSRKSSLIPYSPEHSLFLFSLSIVFTVLGRSTIFYFCSSSVWEQSLENSW